MDKQKPFNPGQQPTRPQPNEEKPYIEHGEYEKKDNPQNDRYKPNFDPKPGDEK